MAAASDTNSLSLNVTGIAFSLSSSSLDLGTQPLGALSRLTLRVRRHGSVMRVVRAVRLH
jgi:hypothetical protein